MQDGYDGLLRDKTRPSCIRPLGAEIAEKLVALIVAFLGFGRRDVAERLRQAAIVEPVDPGQRGELHGLEAAPGSPPMDHLCLVEAVDRFGESFVIGIADAADGRLDARLARILRHSSLCFSGWLWGAASAPGLRGSRLHRDRLRTAHSPAPARTIRRRGRVFPADAGGREPCPSARVMFGDCSR